MAENESPPPPSRPAITLPPASSSGSFFTGGPSASPGPMTLLSTFFPENEPDAYCRSFSQLLGGAMPTVGQPAGEFMFQQNRPAGLAVSQPLAMFTVPPGLSPASLLDSPQFFPSSQVRREINKVASNICMSFTLVRGLLENVPRTKPWGQYRINMSSVCIVESS